MRCSEAALKPLPAGSDANANEYIPVIPYSITGEQVAKIYEKGQVVIPEHIRSMFKLHPGDQVHFRVEGGKIVIEPAYNVLEEFRKLRAELATHSDEETDRLIKESRKKMYEGYLHVPGR